MEAIPGDVLMQFDAVLEQKRVPTALHDDYRKWPRYYPLPDNRAEQDAQGTEKPAQFLNRPRGLFYGRCSPS